MVDSTDNELNQNLAEVWAVGHKTYVMAQIKKYKEEIDQYPNDALVLFKKILELLPLDDRLVAILFYSLIEDEIEKEYERVITSKAHDIFKGWQAPLGTSSSRLRLAWGLNWISEELYRAILQLRNIRNEFAHNFEAKNFNDNKIQSHIKNLPALENRIYELSDKRAYLRSRDDLSTRDLFIIRAIFLFADLLMAIRYRPLAYLKQVPVDSLFGSDRHLPHRISRIMAVAALLVSEFCSIQSKQRDFSKYTDEDIEVLIVRISKALPE